jgi:hypothetical protein
VTKSWSPKIPTDYNRELGLAKCDLTRIDVKACIWLTKPSNYLVLNGGSCGQVHIWKGLSVDSTFTKTINPVIDCIDKYAVPRIKVVPVLQFNLYLKRNTENRISKGNYLTLDFIICKIGICP